MSWFTETLLILLLGSSMIATHVFGHGTGRRGRGDGDHNFDEMRIAAATVKVGGSGRSAAPNA
jgi:hypothetical protein